MVYQIHVKQTNHMVAQFVSFVNIQIGDKLDYVKGEKGDQYRGLVVERLILAAPSEEKFPFGREDVHTIQLVIDQEVPL